MLVDPGVQLTSLSMVGYLTPVSYPFIYKAIYRGYIPISPHSGDLLGRGDGVIGAGNTQTVRRIDHDENSSGFNGEVFF